MPITLGRSYWNQIKFVFHESSSYILTKIVKLNLIYFDLSKPFKILYFNILNKKKIHINREYILSREDFGNFLKLSAALRRNFQTETRILPNISQIVHSTREVRESFHASLFVEKLPYSREESTALVIRTLVREPRTCPVFFLGTLRNHSFHETPRHLSALTVHHNTGIGFKKCSRH